mmetsp:Transcript_12152/g.48922  ORF Transcript_12152/g.48922 Transcript_12152/m.48922 type:complete len:209 (-) Transcript_12152:689-1315(-)
MDTISSSQRARRICEKKLGPLHSSTVKVLFILSSMREADGTKRGPADMNLHFVIFNLTNADSSHQGYYKLARILRRRIFVDELGIQDDVEFDELDGVSRHSIGLFGDAPASYARWRVNGEAVVVDRLCTLPGYRMRHVARKCLENLAQNVAEATGHVAVQRFIMLVPRDQTILQHKLMQANFVPLMECTNGHIPSVQMCFLATTLYVR